MKAIYKLLFAAALILGFSACMNKEIEEPAVNTSGYEIVNGLARVVLTTGEQTKTSMATDGSVLWSEDDYIAVFVNGNLYSFDLTEGAGTTSATFVGYVDPSDLEATGLQAAAYPCYSGMTYENGVIKGIYIPNTQFFYYDGSFWDYTLPMVGEISGTTINFTNAAAVLRLVLNDPELGTLEYLRLTETSTDDSITLDCTYKTATVTAEGLDFYFVVPAGGQEYVVSDGTNEIGIYHTSEPVQAGSRYILHEGPAVSNVCMIGDTAYETLAEAVAAAGSTATITMIADETIVQTVSIPADANITLDLNGKTLSMVATEAHASALIQNKGTLNITGDGTITSNTSAPDTQEIPGYASNTITNLGVLTIDGANISNTTVGGGACYAIDNQTNGTAWTPTLTINSGNISANATALRLFCNSTTNLNSMVVNGGTIQSGSYGIMFQNPNAYKNLGSLVVTGGTFNSSATSYPFNIYMYAGAGSDCTGMSLSISNGQFNQDVALSSAIPASSVSVTGGTFGDCYSWSSDDCRFISGGRFEEDPSDFVVDGYEAVEEGGYYIVKEKVANFARVNSTLLDWSGEYLLVYEKSATEAYCWNGTDAASCYAPATIAEGYISGVPSGAVTITIAPMSGGYSIMVNGGDNDGKFVGNSSGQNGLIFNESEIPNLFDGLLLKSYGTVMRFNSTSNQMRFRYYKSDSYTNQKEVYLYKKGGTYVPPTFYDVNIETVTNGEISANPTSAVAGTQITLSADPDDGYILSEWNVKDADENDIQVENNQFTMPASSVTVSATFVEDENAGGDDTGDDTGDDNFVTLTIAAGTNGTATACTVNGVDGIKLGASKSGGDCLITVPAGKTTLVVYAAAWNGVSGLSLNITGATIEPTSISLTADSRIANNSPFTLNGNAADYRFEISVPNSGSDTTLTFTTSAAKRCVVWGASAK